MPYVSSKHVLTSKTFNFNALLLGLAALLAAIPDNLSAPPFAQIVAAMPEHWRVIVGSVVGVVAAVNVLLRLVTKGPVTISNSGA